MSKTSTSENSTVAAKQSVKPINRAYKLKSVTNSPAYVGEPSKSRFMPTVTLKRWGEECKLSLKLTLGSEVQGHYAKDNVVHVAAKSADFNVFQNKDSLEIEAVFNEKPASMTVPFKMSNDNLQLLYQAPLTEEYAEEECDVYTETHVVLKNGREIKRPENVIYSYAVYHATRRNNKYKTGKAFHIYRPKLIDAKGKVAWCTFKPDADKTGKLEVVMPETFFDTAVFPVVLDPTFGYTSIGGTDTSGSGDYLSGCKFTASDAGTISSLSLYSYLAGPVNGVVGIYSDNAGAPDAKLAQSAEQAFSTSPAWNVFPVSYSHAASTVYWLADSEDGSYRYYYDTGTANQHAYQTITYSATMLASFSPSGYVAEVVSFYATYTAAGSTINGYPITVQSESLQGAVDGISAEWTEWEDGEAVLKQKGYGGTREWSFTCFENTDDVAWEDSVAYLLESVVDAKTPVVLTLDFGDKHSVPADTMVYVGSIKYWYSAGMKVRYFTITVKRAPT